MEINLTEAVEDSMDIIHDFITNHSHGHKHPVTRVSKLEQWLNDNCPFKITIDEVDDLHNIRRWAKETCVGNHLLLWPVFWFELEEDAVLFKMVWG